MGRGRGVGVGRAQLQAPNTLTRPSLKGEEKVSGNDLIADMRSNSAGGQLGPLDNRYFNQSARAPKIDNIPLPMVQR